MADTHESQTLEPIFKVSEFTEMVNMHLSQLGQVVIEGEISELNTSQNKWLFITLKDETSNITIFGVLYKLSGWRQLEEGMLVHVYGSPHVHARSGRFSVTAEKIVPAGEGSLKIAFEKLKKQLETEGLFDPSRKRELPDFPQKVGLITAKGSQAYNDFVKILEERMGGMHVLFAPVSVQGNRAVDSICNALEYFNDKHDDLDAIVVCRGGGSLEDLHAFNDERVVRSIFSSKIPVVCGVGHEGDISLSDLVADVRASTPSNAAEILVQEREALLNKIHTDEKRLNQYMRMMLQEYKHNVTRNMSQLEHAVKDTLQHIKHGVQAFENALNTFEKGVEQRRTEVMQLERLLTSLDYRNVLKRGYSITRGPNGKIISSTQDVRSGDAVTTRVTDGTIYSNVTESDKDSTYA